MIMPSDGHEAASKRDVVVYMFCSGGEFLSVIEWFSVRQGTQHFTDENKVSRK